MPAKIKFTDEQLNYIKNRYLETLSISRVAAEIGRSLQTVTRRLRQIGILIPPAGRRPLYPTEVEGKKRCRKCHTLKPIEEFYSDHSRSDNPMTHCITCDNKRSKSTNLRLNYGITLEDYETLLLAQNGTCAICHEPETRRYPTGRVSNLCVDHDHETGKIRGLLCHRCNQAVGYLRDRSGLCLSAAAYLTHGGADR
jgi:hypothetical protein